MATYGINGVNFTNVEGSPYVRKYSINQTYFVHVTVFNQTNTVTARSDLLDASGTLVYSATSDIGTGPGAPYDTDGSISVLTTGLATGLYQLRVYTDGRGIQPGISDVHIWITLVSPFVDIISVDTLGPYGGSETLTLTIDAAGVSGMPTTSLTPIGGGPPIYSGPGITIPLAGSGITAGEYVIEVEFMTASGTHPLLNNPIPGIKIARYNELNYRTIRPGADIVVYWAVTAPSTYTVSLILLDSELNTVGSETGLDPETQFGTVTVDPTFAGGTVTLRVELTDGVSDFSFDTEAVVVGAAGIYIDSTVPTLTEYFVASEFGYIDIIPSFGGTDTTYLIGKLVDNSGTIWHNGRSYSTAINAYVEYIPTRILPTGSYNAYIESGSYWKKSTLTYTNARVLSVTKFENPVTTAFVAGDQILVQWEGITEDAIIRLLDPDHAYLDQATSLNDDQYVFTLPLVYNGSTPLSNGLICYAVLYNSDLSYGSEEFAFTIGPAIDNVNGRPDFYVDEFSALADISFNSGDRLLTTWAARGTTATMNAQFYESDHTTPAGSPITGIDASSGAVSISIPTNFAIGTYYLHFYDDTPGTPIEQSDASDLVIEVAASGPTTYAYNVVVSPSIAYPGDDIHVTWNTAGTGATAITLETLGGVLLETVAVDAEDLSGDITIPSGSTGLTKLRVFGSSYQTLWGGLIGIIINGITVGGVSVATYYPGDPLVVSLGLSGLTDPVELSLRDTSGNQVSLIEYPNDTTNANFTMPFWISNGTYSLVGSSTGVDTVSTSLTVANFTSRTTATNTEFQGIAFGNINAVGPRMTFGISRETVAFTTSSATRGFTFDLSNTTIGYISAGISTTMLNTSRLNIGSVSTGILSASVGSLNALNVSTVSVGVLGAGTVNSRVGNFSVVSVGVLSAGTIAASAANALVANASVISVGVVTAGIVNAQEFVTTSDEALKRDIVPFDGGMNIVSELHPVMYRYRNMPEGPIQVGFIAQQVEHVLPNVVSLVGGVRGVSYDRLVTVLVNALKEQGGQISTLQGSVSELRNDISTIRG